MSDTPTIDENKLAAIARGERLKKIRNLANLSRRQMCTDSDINIDTLIGWEVARHGGLSAVGARKITERVAKEGVFCTSDWLLHGTAPLPKVILNTAEENHLNEGSISIEERKILAELSYFKSHYPKILTLTIQDGSMLPFFEVGDHIAGVTRYKHSFDQILNKPCIVELKDHTYLPRILKQGSKEGFYALLCTNYDTCSSAPIHNVEVLSAALITWHRKKEPEDYISHSSIME